jgi:hypothetical protein
MPREVPVTAAGAVEPGIAERLRRELGERRTLAGVLDWARSQHPARTIHEIVTQDEYTHDILVELEPRLWLVLDTN